MELQWVAVNPNNLNTGKYYIYRRLTGTNTYTLLGNVATKNGTQYSTYTDASLTNPTDWDKSYTYYVMWSEAVNPATPSGDEMMSRVVSSALIIDMSSFKATSNVTDIALSFTVDNHLNSSYSYNIQRKVNSGIFTNMFSTNFIFNTVTENNSYSHIDDAPSSSCDEYTYRIVVNAFSKVFYSPEKTGRITGSTKFDVADPFKATKGEYAGYTRLRWKVQKQMSGVDETFKVFRRVYGSNSAWDELETVVSGTPTTYWNDNNLLTGVIYEYKVTLYQICSGEETELESQNDIGFTQAFGNVSGRVTYGTGNSVPGVNMLVRRNDLQNEESQYKSLYSSGGGQKWEVNDSALITSIWDNPWTLQFWINPSAANTETNLAIGRFGYYNIRLRPATGGYTIGVGEITASVFSSAVIPANHFSHITMTRNGNILSIYTVCDINPDSVYITHTSCTYTSSFPSLSLPSALKIMNFGQSLVGYIDEIRLWDRALTQTEIERDYGRILMGNESGLRGYWGLDYGVQGYSFDMSRVGTVFNSHHASTNTLSASDVVPESSQLALKGITDANGNYQIGGIPYQGEGTSYSIVPSYGVHIFNPTEQLRYISPTSMVHNATDFTDVSAFTVTGTVVYEGGNYPVGDCSFEIDDQILTKANGEAIKSRYDGTFSISVPIGVHKVRIVKQGHVFVNDGLLIDEITSENLNYNAPLANVKFYDQTRIKFIGRIVGGAIEDDKLLGFGETVNNIGVQTIKLESTLPQYDFTTTPVTQTFSHNEGQWRNPNGLQNDHTSVTYNSDDITISVSSTTGEFVAMIYPEAYNIASVSVPGANATMFTVYDNHEMIDLSNKAFPDSTYLQTSVRTWNDSAYIRNRPGVVDHWEYFESSDTVRYNASWEYCYSATPTFSIKQIVDGQTVDYFGDKIHIIKDSTNSFDTLRLYNENTGAYFFDNMPVFHQGKQYTFRLTAYEQYTNYVPSTPVVMQYAVKEGKVNMSNDIRLNPAPETIDLDTAGKADYRFTAGTPNTTTGQNNFFATLSLGSVSYYWDKGTNPITAWHLGETTTGTDFMTTGPDQLTAILRDPPGSNSSAYIEKGTTVTSTSSIKDGKGIIDELNLTTSLGPKIITWVGFCAGVIMENEIKAEIAVGLTLEETYSTENETSVSTSFTERFSTSDDPLYVGANGDVFIGNSTNILYGLTNGVQIQKGATAGTTFDSVRVNNKDYKIASSAAIAYGQTFATRFAYTQVELETIMIPKWEESIALRLKPVGHPDTNVNRITAPVYVSRLQPGDNNYGKTNTDRTAFPKADLFSPYDGLSYKIYFPASWTKTSQQMQNFQDSIVWANNQINAWKAVLAKNEQEKVQMINGNRKKNYSFGGGATIEYSETVSNTSSYMHNYTMVLNPSVGGTVGGEVMGIGIELQTQVTLSFEHSETTGGSTETTSTTGFILAEEGDDDEITVDYGIAGNTFAFKTRGGRTTCPYEDELRTKYYQPGNHILNEATMQIEVPQISVSSAPMLTNIPANRTASFSLALTNGSETGEDVWFQLIIDESTNPYGADLKIDGAAIGNGRLFLVKAGEVLRKTITMGKGPDSSKYENIAIVLRSQCQSDPTDFIPDIADTTYISAEFVPGVSEVDILEPVNNFILNADSQTGDTLYIKIGNFDVNFANFGYIKLEYRPISSPSWNTLTYFYPDSIYAYAPSPRENIGSQQVLTYPWKMPPADGQYEIRATTASCNIVDNIIIGNPLSTYSTEAIVGWKDQTRPTSLGSPSPANAILSAGDELSITFNEDIQTGMLTVNNFSISGVLNAQEIAEPNVGLAFTGSQDAHTELPIFASGSFSIETWFQRNTNGTPGTLFAYGQNDNYISLAINASGQAVVTIGNETYTSNNAITNDVTWKYIAMTYNRDSNAVTVYEFEGSTTQTLISNHVFSNTATVETQGKLFVGNNADGTDGFEGAIAELHFYNIARPLADVSADKSLNKSGREYGLTGYWKMDEGEGEIAVDKARARNLVLSTDWYIYPSGNAMETDGQNTYLGISTATYPLNAFSDFTLEFWFRSANTAQSTITLFSADKGNIGINANKALVLYKPDGTVSQLLTTNNLIDDQWHHIALSVKRGGSAKVYIDGISVAVFNETLLGDFSSGYYYFGAKRDAYNYYTEHFAGYFDEIRLWNSALTADGIRLNKNNKLRGDENGLQAYYPFETYIKQSNGLITVFPIDTSVTDGNTVTGGAMSSTTAVSVKDVSPVEDVPFSYVASERKIVFTLDESYFERIEGTTLSISVKDILDMRGNKSNVERWTAYINRNALLWDTETINLTKEEGANLTFTARIINNGGTTVSYALENLPMWLSVNSSTGNLQPLASKELTFTVYQGINIGNYETAIGLTSGNGVSELLAVMLKVTGEKPIWSVNPADFESSMNITGQITIAGVYQEDEEDILAAFIGETCIGITSPIYVEIKNAYYIFMDVYGNTSHNNLPVTFKLWDASTGLVYPKIVTSVSDIRFASSSLLGIPNPVIFDAIDISEQSIPLKRGWTWISTNVLNSDPTVFNQMKTSLGSTGEMIKGRNAYVQQPNWAGTLTEISATGMYLIKTTAEHSLVVEGAFAPVNTAININQGWNWIGYIPSFSLSVRNALAGINAQEGDIVKGQSGYATWSGNGWIGTLTYMQPGKGYMYYSNTTATQSLVYPSTNSQVYSILSHKSTTVTPHYSFADNQFASSMTITSIAINDDEEVRSTEVEIAAFSGDNCRGSVILQNETDTYLAFLTIYGDGNEPITFKMYDHATAKEYVSTNAPIDFVADAIHGDPSQPYPILFGNSTGIDVLSDGEEEISIRPNPVSDVAIIEGLHAGDIVTIVDLTGRKLRSFEATSNNASISVDDFAAGLYLIQVNRNGSQKVLKLQIVNF
jgi:hypothetical protein